MTTKNKACDSKHTSYKEECWQLCQGNVHPQCMFIMWVANFYAEPTATVILQNGCRACQIYPSVLIAYA
jgi:hypothetical protein